MKTHDVHWLFAALGVATLGAAAATVAAGLAVDLPTLAGSAANDEEQR